MSTSAAILHGRRSVRGAARKRGIPSIASTLIIFSVFAAMLGATRSPDALLVASSILTLAAIVFIIWRSEAAAVLALPALFQWSEVAIIPISTTWTGQALAENSRWAADLEAAAYYGLLGVVALSLGLAVGAGRKMRTFSKNLEINAMQLGAKTVVSTSLLLIVFSYTIELIAPYSGGASQFLLHLSGIKYCGLFALIYWSLRQNRYQLLAVGIILFEVGVGMTGFFADFKGSVLTLFAATVASRPRLSARDALVVVLSVIILLGTAVFWSAVKSDYRDYVNRGTGTQSVQVAFSDRVSFLSDKAINADGELIKEGFERLVVRHGYIDFLALTLENVPENRAHQDGALTTQALIHIATPRVLFPNKPVLRNDTEIMVEYTGLRAVWDNNTSISLGNLAEMYIDFGYYGGLIAEFVIGFAVGCLCRYLFTNAKSGELFTAGLGVVAVLPLAYFGTSYLKLLSGLIYAALVVFLAQNYMLPNLLRQISKRRLTQSKPALTK